MSLTSFLFLPHVRSETQLHEVLVLPPHVPAGHHHYQHHQHHIVCVARLACLSVGPSCDEDHYVQHLQLWFFLVSRHQKQLITFTGSRIEKFYTHTLGTKTEKLLAENYFVISEHFPMKTYEIEKMKTWSTKVQSTNKQSTKRKNRCQFRNCYS